MSREASYGKTKLNNVREDVALTLLLAEARFQRPDSLVRRRILELLGLGKEFSNRVFDLVESVAPLPPLTLANVEEFLPMLTLIEVKATKKAIADENLHGFFFGATEKEYQIAERLGERYKFAFVVLNPKDGRPPFYVRLSLADVHARTQTKRTQFQVNFRGRPRA